MSEREESACGVHSLEIEFIVFALKVLECGEALYAELLRDHGALGGRGVQLKQTQIARVSDTSGRECAAKV